MTNLLSVMPHGLLVFHLLPPDSQALIVSVGSEKTARDAVLHDDWTVLRTVCIF